MDNHKDQFAVVKMSQVFGVSRSGYYRWRGRGPSNRALENRHLSRRIKKIWEDSYKTYGSPRIHEQLDKEGEPASRPRVARLMKKMGIQSQIRSKWVKTTDSSHDLPAAPNRLNRDFSADGLGQAWVGDITYLDSAGGWLYLTTVMDLADRQIIGWSLSSSMKASQTSMAALQEAIQARTPSSELIFHSDQGIQYCCESFKGLLTRNNMTQSMSRKGNCWDNAPAESFFKTFKAELPIDTSSCNYSQVRQAVFEFIEIWYNRNRLHSSLDYLSPAQMEQKLKHKQAA